MGPKFAVPAISAGGAVDEPLPSISTWTLGYISRKSSAHSVIRLFMVSEPTLLMEPETPETFEYAGMLGSTASPSASVIPAKTSIVSETTASDRSRNGL